MRRLLLGTFFCLISITGQCQLINLDFENWDSAAIPKLNHWEHLHLYTAMPNNSLLGTHIDSDAEHGQYALKLNRWYSGEEFDWVRQRAAYSLKPDHINGYYKYTDNDSDTGLVAVFLTKWNSTNNANDTVGAGAVKLLSNSSYTLFTCPIIYTSGQTPDSITIDIMPTYNKKGSGGSLCTDPTGNCSYLTIDNLSVSAPTDVTHIVTSEFDIYPNPVRDKLVIHTSEQLGPSPITVCIIDIIGNVVFRSNIDKQNTELDLSGINAGNYFIMLQNKNGGIQVKRLLKL